MTYQLMRGDDGSAMLADTTNQITLMRMTTTAVIVYMADGRVVTYTAEPLQLTYAPKIFRARPTPEPSVDYAALSREHMERYPKIRAELAGISGARRPDASAPATAPPAAATPETSAEPPPAPAVFP